MLGGTLGVQSNLEPVPAPSKEVCEAYEIYLCPRGDHNSGYQRLSDTCTYAKVHPSPRAPLASSPGVPKPTATYIPLHTLPSSHISLTTRAPCFMPSS